MAHSRCCLVPLVAASLLPMLGAQAALVLPASHAAHEGSSATNLPFGRGTPTRLQCAYDRSLFAGGLLLAGLRLRPDGDANIQSKLVELEIRASTLPHTLVQLSADFAVNRGVDEVVVLPRQLVQLPAAAAQPGPAPFLPVLAFQQPFAYDPVGGPLLLEFIVYGQPPGSYALDLTYVCDSPEQGFGPPACPLPGGGSLQVECLTTQLLWGRPFQLRMRGAPAQAPLLLGFGNQEQGAWQGFWLPQELSALGAPGCHLSLDLAATVFALAGGDGSALLVFAVPNNPAVVGYWFRYQAAAVVPAANALGLVTSAARKVEVCGMEPVGRVWSSGIVATAGVLELGSALVLELH